MTDKTANENGNANSNYKVYGMVHGIEGFLQERIVDLSDHLEAPDGIELLKRTPSAFLGSCRFKMPQIEGHEDVYEEVFEILDKYDIECFFYAGGNDSMDTVKMLSDYAKMHGKRQRFMGIPKTIDNDLPITDHCPGYGSVAKYIATSVKEIIRDNESFGAAKPTVCIVETMGRNAGWITAAAALVKGTDSSGCDAIYVPEKVFDIDDFLTKVDELAKYKSSIVIAITEGIRIADGRFVSELANANAYVDAFGHIQNTGAAAYLAQLVSAKTGLKTRTVELSNAQRSASHMASLTDIDEAFAAGFEAVKAADRGETGCMTVLVREEDSDLPDNLCDKIICNLSLDAPAEILGLDGYKCTVSTYDIHEIANVERVIPEEWFNEDGCSFTKELIDYIRPLIMGELTPIYKGGLPKHLVLKNK